MAARLLGLVLHQIFNDFLFGIERLEVVQRHGFHGDLHDLLFRNALRTLLAGQVELAGLHQHLLGHEAHDFGTRYLQATGGCSAADLLVGHMERRRLDIRDIHGNLCNAVFVYIPTDCLAALERSGNPDLLAVFILEQLAGQRTALAGLATLLADVEGDGHGAAGGGGVEVVVDRYQEVAGAHVGGAAAGSDLVPALRREIRPALGIGNLFRKGLVFAGAADRQILPLRLVGSGLVAVAGDPQFNKKALRKLSGQ